MLGVFFTVSLPFLWDSHQIPLHFLSYHSDEACHRDDMNTKHSTVVSFRQLCMCGTQQFK